MAPESPGARPLDVPVPAWWVLGGSTTASLDLTYHNANRSPTIPGPTIAIAGPR